MQEVTLIHTRAKASIQPLPALRTSAGGRSCVCTGLSHRPSHRAHSPGPPRLRHHPFRFYWPQPQNTAALLDTKGTETDVILNTDSSQW